MAIVQKLKFETDDLSEFITILKAYLPVAFSPGCNMKEEYHNMYYNISESPRYWLLEDQKDEPKRKCVIALSHFLCEQKNNDEIKVKMDFETNKDGNLMIN